MVLQIIIRNPKETHSADLQLNQVNQHSNYQTYNKLVDFRHKWILLKYNFVETHVSLLSIINLHGVSTKLYFNLIFTMQTYKELISEF